MSQQNNLPTLQFAAGPPTNLPAEVMTNMAAIYDESFSGLGGLGIRRIRVGKAGFILQDGQNKEHVPFDQLFGVFVGSNTTNHAVWWIKDYMPGQEPEEPDLCWLMPTPDTYPDAMPQQFRKKINKNGRDVWAYQILRRVAFVLMRNVNGQSYLDMDKPYIMDISSMSLFGKGMPEQNMYKWAGIRDLCSQNSSSTMQVYPSMFITKIVVDVNAPSGVVMFMPMRDQQTGQLKFLDNNLIIQIHDVAQRSTTRDMLKIREKLTLEGAKETTLQPVQQPIIDPALIQQNIAQYPQQVAPINTGQPVPQQGYTVSSAPNMQAQPQQMDNSFVSTPQTAQQYPSTVVQAPVQVNTPPTGADMNTLLQQAQSILNQGGVPNAPPIQTVPPVQQNVQPQQVQNTVTSVDPSVQANINNLMAQLQG